ncbi:MAG: hypothetical protein EA383_01300 [Spirochaetaceae bacterium]|nr:MAG: hypothetical protein EA383_01300 [Spirochaetaceae bacterium]
MSIGSAHLTGRGLSARPLTDQDIFRSSVIRRTLYGSGQSISQIAQETGVSDQTIRDRLEKHRTGTLDLDEVLSVPYHYMSPTHELALTATVDGTRATYSFVDGGVQLFLLATELSSVE